MSKKYSMIQKLFAVIVSLIICMTISIPILASPDTNADTTTTALPRTVPAPISVEQKNVDGKEYVIKLYDLPAKDDISSIEQAGFVQDNYEFTHFTTEKKLNEDKVAKEVTEETKVETQSNNMEDIIKQLPATKEYSQDGYIGTIMLDTGSIVTEVAGYTTRNYTVSTTREYPGLMYADPSFVSQTATKDGYTLPLTDINWVVMGTGLAGDSLVPTEYKATATYAKSFSSQVPTGYVSTARYKGAVTKTEPGTIQYTVTYIGKPISNEEFSLLKFISIFAAVVLIICAVIVAVLYFRLKKGADIYNQMEKEYINIGHQAIDLKDPVIDLNEFDDMVQSNVFKIVLDSKTTKALFGRNISVTLKDVTVKHLVNARSGEYSFDLDLGGVLDAE